GAGQTFALSETDVEVHMYRRSGTYRPFFETMYRRELTDANTTIALSFAGAANSNFKIDGLPVPGNTYSGRGGAWMVVRVPGELTPESSFLRSPSETRESVALRFRYKE